MKVRVTSQLVFWIHAQSYEETTSKGKIIALVPFLGASLLDSQIGMNLERLTSLSIKAPAIQWRLAVKLVSECVCLWMLYLEWASLMVTTTKPVAHSIDPIATKMWHLHSCDSCAAFASLLHAVLVEPLQDDWGVQPFPARVTQWPC